jgi:hypothetical protein
MPAKYRIANAIISSKKKGVQNLKILRAMQSGRNRSVTDPFSAPYFSARFVKGHLPLFSSRAIPLSIIDAIAIIKRKLNALNTMAYRM